MKHDETLKKQAAINNGNALASSLQTGDISHLGLTKREYFAGLAMQSYASGEYTAQRGMPVEQIAKWSVEMADALLFELENTKP